MRRLLLALVLWLAALPVLAEDAATLVADRVFLNGNDTLTAEGAVEVLYKGVRLTATRIIYDARGETLTIEGPIMLNSGDGTVLLASQAELSRDLRNGVLTSARMVLQDQLQLAARTIRRTGGRLTTLDSVVASSCQICAAYPIPLWEIRARKVTHDQQTRRLTFDNAQLRIAGVPVFWLPRLRLPDPTVERATGFLAPRIRTNSALGFGVKLPYFLTLGDSRDLTLTPYIAASSTRTLEFRYRQAFRTGEITFDGAITRDTLLRNTTRGYVFAQGSFRLPQGYRLSFGLQEVTDRAYLSDYSYSDEDRLATGLTIDRTRRNELIYARAYRFKSIRAGESNATLPTQVGDAVLHRRFTPGNLGGEGGLRLSLAGYRRTSGVTTDTDGDGIADGRDVLRASATLVWRQNSVLTNGMVLAGMGELALAFYAVADDASLPATITRVAPALAFELRWPWLRTTPEGITDVVEPVAQIVWSPNRLTTVPNEDSGVVEFDEGNLFSLNRFPGEDRREQGLRLNLGLGWTRSVPDGGSLALLAGRVIRIDGPGQFTAGSGLDSNSSDWLLATTLIRPDGLSVTNRALFDNRFSFAKDELRLAWATPRYDVAASYIWMLADPAESRPTDTSELSLNAGWQVSEGLHGSLTSRYDLTGSRAAKVGLGLDYTTECASFQMDVTRRFTSPTNASPVTDFNLSVVLAGFGKGKDGRSYRRSCGP